MKKLPTASVAANRDGKEIPLPEKTKASIGRVVIEIGKLIRLEPTCIRCGCTEYAACAGGCAWTYLNKKTNEGFCSACHVKICGDGTG